MTLTDAQLGHFRDLGYVLLDDVFSPEEVSALKHDLPALMSDDSPRRVLEKDGRTVRAIHGCHTTSEACRRLVRHPRMLGPSAQILGSDVYVHQFKINVKAAFTGDIWKWHQDFIFWLKQDGMQQPRAVNLMVFLDDVTEFNGPLYVVPRSHEMGTIDVPPGDEKSDTWRSSFAADLKYALDRNALAAMVTDYGIAAPKGRTGSVLVTHCNLVHGSPPNMSPFDRVLAIVTYNSVHNALLPVPEPRPEFLVSRDFTPLTAVDDDALLSYAAGAESGPAATAFSAAVAAPSQ